MSSLSIGLSGLQVSQKLLDLTGQNIANANTPDYHRQIAELADRTVGTSSGQGVEIKSLTRVVNNLLENAVIRNTSASTSAASQADSLTLLQSYLAPGTGSLNDMLQGFFDEAEKLSTQPADLTQRSVVLAKANDLADRLNATTDDMNQMRNGLADQAKSAVAAINSLTAQIGRLNGQIHDGNATGQSANGLLNQRDRAIADLSELVDVRVVPQELGQVNLLVGGAPVILNSTAVPLKSAIDSQGQLVLTAGNSMQAMEPSGGKLAGILSVYNSVLPAVSSQFNDLARGLVTQLNQIQATGLGLSGPLTSLSSQQTLTNTAQTLSAARLPLPPVAGDLYITVTNTATGARSLNRIAIDPATQTLGSLASAISAIPNVQAVVDSQAGTLNLIARPGYGFDFTGNPSTSPDVQAITGTATPTISGQYTGANNDALHFRVVGSGTIGASPNLALEVRNGAGALVSTVNIGQGYEAGTNLPDVLGVNVKLASGTVNDGDSFQVTVAAHSDTAGILPALGLNSFFIGTSSGDLQVRPDLLAHPERFALSVSGQPGDGSNLAKLVALRDQNLMNNQTQTFADYLAKIIGNVGSQVQDATNRQSAYEALGTQLEDQRQAASGVDTNEELIKLVQYQRSYQMSAHFVSAVNQTLDDLLRLV